MRLINLDLFPRVYISMYNIFMYIYILIYIYNYIFIFKYIYIYIYIFYLFIYIYIYIIYIYIYIYIYVYLFIYIYGCVRLGGHVTWDEVYVIKLMGHFGRGQMPPPMDPGTRKLWLFQDLHGQSYQICVYIYTFLYKI